MSNGTKNKMSDLRNHLFETLEALKDTEKPMDIERARAISQVAKVVVDSAKVEVDFLESIGATTNGDFFEEAKAEKRQQLTNGQSVGKV